MTIKIRTIFPLTHIALAFLQAETDIKKNFVNVEVNEMLLIYLKNHSELNSYVLVASEIWLILIANQLKLTEPLWKYINLYVRYNAQNVEIESEILNGAISLVRATSGKNVAMGTHTQDLLSELSENV